jgi:thioredoxin reductase
VFVAPFFHAQDAVLTDLGAGVEHTAVFSRVVTDAAGATSVPGVWAAGNVADPMAQVIGAAAAGARAAVLAAHRITGQRADAGRRPSRAGPRSYDAHSVSTSWASPTTRT